MDELLQKAADMIGMPPALAKRSAEARAAKEGTTVEAVLREWAGESPAVGETGAAGVDPESHAAPPAEATPEPVAAAAPAPADAPTEITTDYLVALAADAKRMPPKLVRSSAEARARNSGGKVDAVLAAWAGVDLADLEKRVAAGEALPVAEGAPASSSTPSAEGAPTSAPIPPAPAEAAAQPAAAAPAAVAATMSMDELLDKVSEAKGMPPALAKRSAEARAKKTGEPVEAVLAEWAGVEVGAIAAATPAAPAEAAAQPAAAAPAAVAATMSMDELLDKVSEAKGMPPALAKRSAEARAKKTGEPVEAVLAEWAGVEVGAVAAATPAAPAPAAATDPTQASPGADTPSEGDVEVYEAAVPDVAPVDHAGGDSGAVGAEPIGAAPGRRGGYPTWLAAAFILIPLLAVTYVLVSPNGPDCGTAGQLSIDPATGLAVNCDGSEYGSSVVDFFSQGAAIYAQCAACHGAGGEGGVGPAFAGGAVLATFPAGQCVDHVEWVTLGTSGFPEPTYGANNKPVGGGGIMPAFGNALTPEELRAVVLYERVAFGGEPVEEAQVDCGLVTAEGEIVPEDQMVQASDG